MARVTRRTILGLAAAAPAWLAAQNAAKQFANLGGAPAGFPIRTRAGRGGAKPFDFVDHCHGLGLGVVETRLAGIDTAAVKALRQKVEGYHMRLILDVGYPRDQAGVAVFEAGVKAAAECGAISLHAAMTGRRYEDMNSVEEFRQNFERAQTSIALAEPILRKHRMRLGIENHKGWRSAEQAAWLKRVSSEWVGVHFDFGNNLSLCEVPADTLRNLLPYTVACHIKDMALQPYEEGFLLSEVPLGEGVLDLKGMVATLRGKDANMPFDLEMITRDPLKVPVLTDKYWASFDDTYSPLPGRDMAKIVALINRNHPKGPLPRTTGLSPEAQLKLEDECIAKSIEYARGLIG
ncbi:MAG: Xylose isomerase domain protein barrel [Candidatus Solibacter sp.]|nr:Xylose isomerase domain protein barrel [Candidatus Solibacter sp.]